MNGNYPPGVTDAHPYFNPPECPGCGGGLDEENRCLDPESDRCRGPVSEDDEIDAAFDRMRDEEF